MSLSPPSQVSATTGSEKPHDGHPRRSAQAITASRTTPTLSVLVSVTGPARNPDSRSQWVPVISPLPFSVANAAKTGSLDSLPRGKMAVTPVRTGPLPRTRRPLPEISVAWPTLTPGTSVMALAGPGVPGKGRPSSRARARVWASTGRVRVRV